MKVKCLKEFLEDKHDEMEIKLLVTTVFKGKCEFDIGCVHTVQYPIEADKHTYILISD